MIKWNIKMLLCFIVKLKDPNIELKIIFLHLLGYGGGIFTEDPYLHVNKRELVGGALLLGAGIAKGIIITGLVNSLTSKTGVQIGKKK